MPVILGEVRVLTRPLSGVRICELLCTCLSFSLVSTLGESDSERPVRVFCMFSWCFFFVLTFLILLVDFIQFQSIIPVSWKNLPVTVATLAALMCLSSSVGFAWFVLSGRAEPKVIMATVCSCLAFLGYSAEVQLIRLQAREQRGYMASPPGLLKVLQVFGGCAMFSLLSIQGPTDKPHETTDSLFWLSMGIKALCFLMSLGIVGVMLGDCASRCPLPFDRLLVGVSSLAVVLYIVVTVCCVTNILDGTMHLDDIRTLTKVVPFLETIVACLTLLAYTVDLAFSVKLLCDRV